MSGKENPTGGVKAFSIINGLVRRRDRLLGMTDDERRWRAQWLKDQVLSPEEPRFVPEYYRTTNNFFRRLWQIPAKQFETILSPALGKNGAHLARVLTGATMKSLAVVYILGYILKYHSNDFSIYRSIEVVASRGRMYPQEPNFPDFPLRTPQDYYDLGFYSSVLCVKVTPPEPPPPPPPPPQLPDACGPTETAQ